MKLSRQQRKILTTLAATKRGSLPSDFLLNVVLKIPHRNLAAGNPLATGSQRASFSRSLTRLERDGLICRRHGLIEVTDAGRDAVDVASVNTPEPGSQLLTDAAREHWFGDEAKNPNRTG